MVTCSKSTASRDLQNCRNSCPVYTLQYHKYCRFLVVHEPLLTLRSNMRSCPQIGFCLEFLHEKMMEALNEDVHVDVIPGCKRIGDALKFTCEYCAEK